MTAEQPDPAPIEPDVKDWTWVLEDACDECGFDAVELDETAVPVLLRDNARELAARVARPDASQRPAATVWSPLEYACHVRDLHRLFLQRLDLMLTEDDPEFADWDQDAAAVAGDYARQQPTVVAEELVAAADAVAERYTEVGGSQWHRPGRRSNGSRFTVASFARYHAHDVVHHAHDVGLRPGAGEP